ncbi:hypothetical protein EDB84DRAFT_1673572 [Lactarius hengduanensis]|nr:hypothetical protein EDB84DRAFT_1673572 [Lactarius hengduanensis]
MENGRGSDSCNGTAHKCEEIAKPEITDDATNQYRGCLLFRQRIQKPPAGARCGEDRGRCFTCKVAGHAGDRYNKMSQVENNSNFVTVLLIVYSITWSPSIALLSYCKFSTDPGIRDVAHWYKAFVDAPNTLHFITRERDAGVEECSYLDNKHRQVSRDSRNKYFSSRLFGAAASEFTMSKTIDVSMYCPRSKSLPPDQNHLLRLGRSAATSSRYRPR